MFANYLQEFENLSKMLDDKQMKQMRIYILLRLLKKIEHEEDKEIEAMVLRLKEALIEVTSQRGDLKSIKRQVVRLQEKVKEIFGFYEKGALQAQYTGFGVAIGSGIGVALSTSNQALFAIGIGVGIAIGSGLGSKKEKEAEIEEKLY